MDPMVSWYDHQILNISINFTNNCTTNDNKTSTYLHHLSISQLNPQIYRNIETSSSIFKGISCQLWRAWFQMDFDISENLFVILLHLFPKNNISELITQVLIKHLPTSTINNLIIYYLASKWQKHTPRFSYFLLMVWKIISISFVFIINTTV